MKELEMNDRLQAFIQYKTGGRQTDFANLVGWSPQYLGKLLRGGNFGLQPVLRLLTVFPDLSARWLLLGEGDMLQQDQLAQLRAGAVRVAEAIITAETLTPYMSPSELEEFTLAVQERREPVYSPDTLSKLRARADERQREIEARINAAKQQSDETICRRKTAKK